MTVLLAMAKHRCWRLLAPPKVPAKAVFAITRNPLRLKVAKHRQRDVTLVGGPWDGLLIKTRVPYTSYTLPVKIGQLHGRYKMMDKEGLWENV